MRKSMILMGELHYSVLVIAFFILLYLDFNSLAIFSVLVFPMRNHIILVGVLSKLPNHKNLHQMLQ